MPEGMDCLAYKVVGATDRLADGEEGYLPVLSRRILVSESCRCPCVASKRRSLPSRNWSNPANHRPCSTRT